MSSVANPVLQPSAPLREPKLPWMPLVWFFSLLVLCYAPVLWRLVNQWNTDEDMGHGFFVPVISAYIAWQKRQELFSQQLKSNYLGLALIAFAAVQLTIGTLGAELFLARTAFIESVVGSILFLGGWTAVRILAFPLFLLCFMVPIPSVIYNEITFPLQIFASKVAAFVLELVGIPVLRDGNVLELPSQKLSVVEACSGIRSLLSLSFLSLVYGYFFDNRTWMRISLLVLTVPIAIAANAGRVTLTGILSEINPELTQGLWHTASGWIVFMIALVIMLLTHQFLSRIHKAIHASS
jgi:exosortase